MSGETLISQLTFTCSKSTIETLEKGVEICSQLIIKTLERRQWRRSVGVFIVKFEIVYYEQVNISWNDRQFLHDACVLHICSTHSS